MKKNIALILMLLLEFLLVVFLTIPQLKSISLDIFPFLSNLWNALKISANNFASLIRLNNLLSMFPHRLTLAVSLIILNLIFIIIYEIIASIIVFVIRRNHKKNLIANKLDTYELTEEEKARFSWKLYQKKFSWLGLFSFIIPSLLILFFIIVRFDKKVCLQDEYNIGFTSFYTNNLEPFINSLVPQFNNLILRFINKYISLMEGVTRVLSVKWVEYIFIGIAITVFYFIWFFIVWILKKIFHKSSAKRRARRSKKKYIAKMEKSELKARKAAGERISSKNDAKNISSLGDYYQDASVISLRGNSNLISYSDVKSFDYIEDISSGVIDLGIASTGEEEDKDPIEKKIPVFVGEEDIDIILEKEPIIETIEEENEDAIDEMEPFFEKYIPERIDFASLDDSLLIKQINVVDEQGYYKEKDVIAIKDFKEEIIPHEKEEPEEIKEETKVEKEEPLIEEKNEENKKESQEIIDIEENPQNIVKEEIKSDSKDKPKTIKLVQPINEKETVNNLEEIKEEKIINLKEFTPKKIKKKPIKPISINSNYNNEDRFKDPRSKYFVFEKKDINKEKKEKETLKKRQLIKRKKSIKK